VTTASHPDDRSIVLISAWTDRSSLEAELIRVAEVPITESSKKTEAGHTIESGREARHGGYSEVSSEAKAGKLHAHHIRGERADVRRTERDGLVSGAATEQAILFVKKEFDRSPARAGAGIGQEIPAKGLAATEKCEYHLHSRSTTDKRPAHLSHQGKLQISTTSP
jgi:hypothetical protein